MRLAFVAEQGAGLLMRVPPAKNPATRELKGWLDEASMGLAVVNAHHCGERASAARIAHMRQRGSEADACRGRRGTARRARM